MSELVDRINKATGVITYEFTCLNVYFIIKARCHLGTAKPSTFHHSPLVASVCNDASPRTGSAKRIVHARAHKIGLDLGRSSRINRVIPCN